MAALTYLFKIGGTRNLNSVRLAKEILDHFLQCGMTLTTEYLPSKMNVTPDLESRNNSPVVAENLSDEGNPIDKEGVSRKAFNLIIKSRRSSANSNYESDWGKWASRCGKLVHFVVT